MAIRNWVLGVSIVGLLLSGSMAFAQSSNSQSSKAQLVITWRATRSFVPPGYSAKALSTQTSQIVASVEAFTNSKRVDLKNVTIYWYLNDTLIGGGIGEQSQVFNLFGGSNGFEVLRVEMPDYPGGLSIATTQIPTIQPTVVIEAPYPGGNFSSNPLALKANPYFFNITSVNQLAFSWAVNGQTSPNAENPGDLRVTLGPGTRPGTTLDVKLSATNNFDSTGAGDEKTLTYQPLP